MKTLRRWLAVLAAAGCMLTSCATASAVSSTPLAISQQLHIANVSDGAKISYANYTITGTSDPDLDLTVNGEPVENRGISGTFSVYVPLEYGSNTFTFRQGDQSQTVTLVRPSSTSSSTPKAIDFITQSSMTPAYTSLAEPGETITLTCVAPSTSTVKASVAGKTVVLKQKAATAMDGIPATFTGTVTLPENYARDEVTKVGQVKYTLIFDGKTTTYTSNGALYVAGEESTPMLTVSDDYANVFASASSSASIIGTFQKGVRDYISGEEGSYFKLNSTNGWVHKSVVELITGEDQAYQVPTGVIYKVGQKSESFVIKGVKDIPYSYLRGDGTFSITLYNVTGAPSLTAKHSSLFDSITKTEKADRVTYTFQLKEGESIWGYQVEKTTEGTRLYFHYSPASGSTSQPLENVSVVVDPGHGGSDPGAIGAAGAYGPDEADLNLALAQQVKAELEALGAQVYLTRTEDTDCLLTERRTFAMKYRPDFFLSIHHNSIGFSSDTGKVSGAEVYYYTTQSLSYAQQVLSGLTQATGRTDRGVKWNGFYVNRMTFMPSILLEAGFMGNPVEYDLCADPDTIQASAQGIAQGIAAMMAQ